MQVRNRTTFAWRPHNYKKMNGKKEHRKNSFKGLSQRLKMSLPIKKNRNRTLIPGERTVNQPRTSEIRMKKKHVKWSSRYSVPTVRFRSMTEKNWKQITSPVMDIPAVSLVRGTEVGTPLLHLRRTVNCSASNTGTVPSSLGYRTE